MNKKLDKTYKKRNSVLKYEGRLNNLCHPHINAFNVDKDLFWMSFLNMEKTKFANFHLVSSSNTRFLKKKWKYKIAVDCLVLFGKVFMYICESTRKICRVS